MKKKILTLAFLLITAVSMLTGCGRSKEEAWILQRIPELQFYDENLSDEAARAQAQKDWYAYVDAMERIKKGEKVDSYKGYHDCRISKYDMNSGKMQIADMVFDCDLTLSVEDVRDILNKSQYAYRYFTIVEDFHSNYPCIKLMTKDGKNELIKFGWRVLKEDQYPWVVETGNYLLGVKPVNDDYVPWTIESSYYPGGYLYYFSKFAKKEDTEFFKIKRFTYDELIENLEYDGFTKARTIAHDQIGCYAAAGVHTVEVKYSCNYLKDLLFIDISGDEQFVLNYLKLKYTFDTEGNLTDIMNEGFFLESTYK